MQLGSIEFTLVGPEKHRVRPRGHIRSTKCETALCLAQTNEKPAPSLLFFRHRTQDKLWLIPYFSGWLYQVHFSLSKKGSAGLPFVGWCMINTVSKNLIKNHIQIRKTERGIAKQPLCRHLTWPNPHIAETGKLVTIDALSTIFFFFCLASFFSSFPPSLSRHVSLLHVASTCSSHLLLFSKVRVLPVSFICILPHLRIPFVLFVIYIVYWLPLCAGRVWSISTLHAGPDQPVSSLQFGPDQPDTPNPNPNPNLWGGVRGQMGQSRVTRLRRVFWSRFSTIPGGRKASLDSYEQHPARSLVPTSPAHGTITIFS